MLRVYVDVQELQGEARVLCERIRGHRERTCALPRSNVPFRGGRPPPIAALS